MSDESAGSRAEFHYHLELTPPQLKLVHTALRSLLDGFGHEEARMGEIVREILEKLPDEHAIRAIVIEPETDQSTAGAPPSPDAAA